MLSVSMIWCRPGWRQPLDPSHTLECWTLDHHLVGTLSVALVTELVRNHLERADLDRRVAEALTTTTTAAATTTRPLPSPRKPLRAVGARRLRGRTGVG